MPTTKMKTERRFEIDLERFPAVVIESDDWGAAEYVPTEELCPVIAKILPGRSVNPKLESPAELQALYAVLEKHRGADGLKPVFTAFTCMANPDFDAIRKNGFTEYADIPVDKGFPPGWNGEGIVEAWRDGIRRGVWHPEYHANLHHVSTKLWMGLLNEDSPKGEITRRLFDLNCYSQVNHLPEYEGFPDDEMKQLIRRGFDNFERTFGYAPGAAVTSDAYLRTVKFWNEAGLRTVCLFNFRLNDGSVVTYGSVKPWNFQDPEGRCGDYDPERDVIYLTRNVWFEREGLSSYEGVSAEAAMEAVENNFRKYDSPAVIQAHRSNYCIYPLEAEANRLVELDRLLGMLARRGVFFLTTAELGDLYRQGWSKRTLAEGTVIRKWSVCEPPENCGEVRDLATGKTTVLTRNAVGNFMKEKQ